ncbi:MAG: Hsp20/alpha crystallin family protein [Anaerolineaceae bacterium]|nr:Hsp20/alpha crystallin family protein [Anaerolineaceae bacterium]
MAIKDILPWNRSSEKVEITPVKASQAAELDLFEPIMDHWMNDDWLNSFHIPSLTPTIFKKGVFSPNFDIIESDKEILINVDLPGMEAKDFNISYESDQLIISGEKKIEKKESGTTYTCIGRSYGSFYRRLPILSENIEEDNIHAKYKDGVLQIICPKKANLKKKHKKIQIKSV